MSNSADYAIGCLGVDVMRTDASVQHELGMEVNTRDGCAVYARAAAATPAGSLVGIAPASAGISASAAVATLTSTGNAVNAQIFGIANVSVAVSSYGWFYTQSRNPRGIEVRGATGLQPNTKLYTTGTGGVVDDATISTAFLQGLRVLESAASASTVPCVFHDILVGYNVQSA
jgi:hypothetical protein